MSKMRRKEAEPTVAKRTSQPWIKADVRQWKPEVEGTYNIDILPYTNPSCEDGSVFVRRVFNVHRNIGINNASFVCPRCVGKQCPVCDYLDGLYEDYDKNATEIKSIKKRKQTAYNIINPSNPNEVVVFAFSAFNFSDTLDKEIGKQKAVFDARGEEPEFNKSNLYYYEVTEEGRTVQARFCEAVLGKQAFLQADRVDFVPRQSLEGSDLLSQVYNLDDIFNVPTTKEITAMMNASDDAEDVVEAVVVEQKEDAEDDTDAPWVTGSDAEVVAEEKTSTEEAEKDVCPFGHKFGEDNDSCSDCDDCDKKVWKRCFNAN
jgi:hypothetical protein